MRSSMFRLQPGGDSIVINLRGRGPASELDHIAGRRWESGYCLVWVGLVEHRKVEPKRLFVVEKWSGDTDDRYMVHGRPFFLTR